MTDRRTRHVSPNSAAPASKRADLLPVARSLGLMASGGIAAAVPLFLLVLASNLLTVDGASLVAIALAIVGYLSQLIGATEVESRIPTAFDFRPPRWNTYFAAISLTAGPVSAIQPIAGFILLLPALSLLEPTRMISLAFQHTAKEVCVMTVLVAGAAAAWLSPNVFWATTILSIALVCAILIRAGIVRRSQPPQRRPGWRWILAETTMTGATQPLLTVAVYQLISPGATVSYRILNSVANILSPALGFLRLRLLADSRAQDLWLASTICVAGAATILGAHLTGLTDIMLGHAWNTVSLVAVVLALVARLTALFTVIPFAVMRREGRFKAVGYARAISSLTYPLICLTALYLNRSIESAFLGFVLAEVTTCAIYWMVSNRRLWT